MVVSDVGVLVNVVVATKAKIKCRMCSLNNQSRAVISWHTRPTSLADQNFTLVPHHCLFRLASLPRAVVKIYKTTNSSVGTLIIANPVEFDEDGHEYTSMIMPRVALMIMPRSYLSGIHFVLENQLELLVMQTAAPGKLFKSKHSYQVPKYHF